MRRKRPFRRRARERDHEQEYEPADDQQMATPAEIEAAYQVVAGDQSADHAVDDEQFAADTPDDYNTDEFEAFVPVGRDEFETYAAEDDGADVAGDDGADTTRRRGLPRLTLNVAFQEDVLLVALAFIAAGVFGTLLVRGDVSDDMRNWWPLTLVVVAIVWMLVALVRRQVASFLGAAAFAGVGLSLLMDTQDIARVEETLLGVVLITAGLGIAVRGLLLRQRTAYG